MKTLPRFRASTLRLAAIAAIVAGPLALGQTDCEQKYPPLTGYSVVIDQSRIAYDRNDPNDPNYAQRKPLLAAIVTVSLGHTAVFEDAACDPDGEQVRMRCQDGAITILDAQGAPVTKTPEAGWLALEAGGRYRWMYKPSGVGVTYHWLEVGDLYAIPTQQRYTRGTVVVVTIPKNRPPVLCGGQP